MDYIKLKIIKNITYNAIKLFIDSIFINWFIHLQPNWTKNKLFSFFQWTIKFFISVALSLPFLNNTPDSPRQSPSRQPSASSPVLATKSSADSPRGSCTISITMPTSQARCRCLSPCTCWSCSAWMYGIWPCRLSCSGHYSKGWCRFLGCSCCCCYC